MTPRRSWLLWIGLLLLAGGGAALAQGPGAPEPPAPRPGPGWHGGGLDMMLHRLGLDEAQMDEARAIRLKAEKGRVRQEAEIRIAEIELRELMGASAPDRGKVHTQIDKLAGLRGDMHKLEVDQKLDVLALLTSEQRQKLEHLRRQRPGWEGGAMGEWHGSGHKKAWPAWGPPDPDD